MKHFLTLFVFFGLLLVSTVRGSTTPTDAAVGIANCFNQKISSVLDNLARNAQYICTLNKVAGPLTDNYDPFGAAHGFPLLYSQDLSVLEVYYGTPGGGLAVVGRNESDSTGKTFVGYYEKEGTGYRYLYAVDPNTGELTGSLLRNQTYDPRLRPWYQGAVSTSGVYVTSTPYTLTTTFGLGVTASLQCVVGSTLQIVAGADAQLNIVTSQALTTSTCSQFTGTASEVVYVVNSQGILVLQSGYTLSSLGSATNSSTPLVQAAATWAAGQTSVASGEFTYSGTVYEYYSRPLSTLNAWGWTLVVVRPTTNECSSAVSGRSVGYRWIF